jgi:hypothetical protein
LDSATARNEDDWQSGPPCVDGFGEFNPRSCQA